MVSDFLRPSVKTGSRASGCSFLDLLVSAVLILSLMFYWKNADQGAWMFIPLGNLPAYDGRDVLHTLLCVSDGGNGKS